MPFFARKSPAPSSELGAPSPPPSRQSGRPYDAPVASSPPGTSAPYISQYRGKSHSDPAVQALSARQRSVSSARPAPSHTSRATHGGDDAQARSASFSGSSFATMKIPVPEIDSASDRLARACGQEPTDLEKFNISPAVKKEMPEAPWYPVQDPRKICRLLDQVLHRKGLQVRDYLEVEDLLEGKYDTGEYVMEHYEIERVPSPKAESDGELPIFGAALLDITGHATVSVEYAGFMHELPAVVYACIEELYRTGIYQPALFRTLPNRERLFDLVQRFDLPSSSKPPNMRHQNTADICALLITYVYAIPSPLVARCFYDALWNWCAKPSLVEIEASRVADSRAEADEFLRQTHNRRQRAASDPVKTNHEKEMSEAENAQIAAAQYVLRLLPPLNFSLLVYLFGFFTQLPLCPENGTTLQDIGNIFATRLLGGPHAHGATILLVWLLKRWQKISEALFEDESERARCSIQARRGSAISDRTSQRNAPSTLSTGAGNLHERMEPSQQRMNIRPFLQGGGRDRTPSVSSASSGSSWTSASDVPVIQPFDIDNRKHSGISELEIVREAEDESSPEGHGFDAIRANIPSDARFLTPLNGLFDQMSFTSTTDTDSEYSPDEGSRVGISRTASQYESTVAPNDDVPSNLRESLYLLSLARRRASVLTGQLEATKLTVRDALEDTATVQHTAEARLTAQGFSERVNALESAPAPEIDIFGDEDISVASQVARRFVVEKDNAELRKRLEDAVSERDEARAVMSDLRKVFERRG